MSAQHRHGPGCGHLHRRAMLVASAAALAGCSDLGGGPAATASLESRTLRRAARDAMTPEEVLAMLRQGNERFVAGVPKPRDWLAQQRATAAGQYPAAVLLSCIDSRAPAEVVLDMGLGEIFNNRIAGNVADVAVLGGMEFACQLAGAKVVLVMGHTACGAVAGAVAGAELGNLTALLAKIAPAVEATPFSGERSAANPAFVDAVARTNVTLTMADIRASSPVLAALEGEGAIRIAGAMYDLESGRVDFFA